MSNIEAVHIGLVIINLLIFALHFVADWAAITDLREQVAELHEKRDTLQKQLERISAQIINKE